LRFWKSRPTDEKPGFFLGGLMYHIIQCTCMYMYMTCNLKVATHWNRPAFFTATLQSCPVSAEILMSSAKKDNVRVNVCIRYIYPRTLIHAQAYTQPSSTYSAFHSRSPTRIVTARGYQSENGLSVRWHSTRPAYRSCKIGSTTSVEIEITVL
jgi:hypothetical protein